MIKIIENIGSAVMFAKMVQEGLQLWILALVLWEGTYYCCFHDLCCITICLILNKTLENM